MTVFDVFSNVKRLIKWRAYGNVLRHAVAIFFNHNLILYAPYINPPLYTRIFFLMYMSLSIN